MGKRSYTKVDKIRAEKLRELGCIVCWSHDRFTPPAIHHIDGQTKEGCHALTIPLCPKHHQEKDNHKPPRWISRHGDGRALFEATYGDELRLLERTNEMICNYEN